MIAFRLCVLEEPKLKLGVIGQRSALWNNGNEISIPPVSVPYLKGEERGAYFHRSGVKLAL
jgi:hypothetical protein